MAQTTQGVSEFATQTRAQNEKIIEKLYAAAQPGAAFSAPVRQGEYTVITATEIGAGGGFGFGVGSSPQSDHESDGQPEVGGGGGGAGGSMARPVATIVIGPDGVKVRPIVDATKLGIAAIGAWSAVALVALRATRKARH